MIEDNKGFLYPSVDMTQCIDCGLCNKVCIEYAQFEKRFPIKAYASKNYDDEVRGSSSSGGIFPMLAKAVLERGGVVFGVRFDDKWECVHDYIEDISEIHLFQGSKYVPSRIGDSYIKAEKFLKEGRAVLFSGTSCQIAALNRFLGQEYANLLTLEVTCHGVPSPAVWRKYLDTILKRARKGKNTVSALPIFHHKGRDTLGGSAIERISFRDKGTGWEKFSFALSLGKPNGAGKKNSVSLSHTHEEDPFMRLFIYDVILRPSCYHCPAKSGKTMSDFTLADFWHIDKIMPDFNDDKGVTLVYLNTLKAIDFYNRLQCDDREMSIQDATERKVAWFLDNRKKNPFRSLYFLLYHIVDFDSLANFVTNYKYVKIIKKILKIK